MLFKKLFYKLKRGNVIEYSDSISEDLTGHLTDQAEQLAYKKILRHSHFLDPDGLNEYDEDYRFFIPRGDLVTAEMRNALERLESTDQKPPCSEEGEEESSALENKDPDSDPV